MGFSYFEFFSFNGTELLNIEYFWVFDWVTLFCYLANILITNWRRGISCIFIWVLTSHNILQSLWLSLSERTPLLLSPQCTPKLPRYLTCYCKTWHSSKSFGPRGEPVWSIRVKGFLNILLLAVWPKKFLLMLNNWILPSTACKQWVWLHSIQFIKVAPIRSYIERGTPTRWNRTTPSLDGYRFEACTPDHRSSSGHGFQNFILYLYQPNSKHNDVECNSGRWLKHHHSHIREHTI